MLKSVKSVHFLKTKRHEQEAATRWLACQVLKNNQVPHLFRYLAAALKKHISICQSQKVLTEDLPQNHLVTLFGSPPPVLEADAAKMIISNVDIRNKYNFST